MSNAIRALKIKSPEKDAVKCKIANINNSGQIAILLKLYWMYLHAVEYIQCQYTSKDRVACEKEASKKL